MINAWVAEGEKWMLEGEDEPALRFWGASMELHLNWLDRLTFSDGDAYSWKKVMHVSHHAFSWVQIRKFVGGIPPGCVGLKMY